MVVLWIYNGFIRNMINSRTLLCKDYMIPATIIYIILLRSSHPRICAKKTLHDSTTGSLVALLPALDASGISQLSLPAVLGGLVTPRCCPLLLRGKSF